MKKADKSPDDMSLLDFNEKFGTEDQCHEHLFAKRFANGFVCPKCGHTRGSHLKKRRVMQCNACSFQVSATSGTVMHDTKMPLRKWYLAIYLITSGKRGISAKELQRHIHVTYKTAWYVNKRIRAAMSSADKDKKLDGIVTVDEAYFSGRESEEKAVDKPKKRGRGTNKSKVIVAVSLDKNGKPLRVKMRVAKNFRAKTLAEFARDSITVGSIIRTDGFKAYKGQELKKDYFHEFENFDKSNENSPLKWLHIVISNAKALINGTFHGLKRLELQSYLDEFCFRFNRRYSLAFIHERLIAYMISTTPVLYYSNGVVG